MKYSLAILLVGASYGAMAGNIASAQVKTGNQSTAQSPVGLEDIVVTARKREESLMSVPVAVAAISQAKLAQSGATDLTSIARLAPQVSVTRGESGSGATFSIRGLGTPFTDGGLEQSVTVNIDGVQISRGNIVSIGLFDLQQVEVLKGPQALFFGKNSPAGVISLRSITPTDKLEGYIKAGYEFNARERYAEAAISGPITETLKGRIAVRGMQMRGWLTNVAQGYATNPLWGSATPGRFHDHNSSKELTGRATLVWDPVDNFSATLKVAAGVTKSDAPAFQGICPGNNGNVTTWGLEDTALPCKYDKYFAAGGISADAASKWPGTNGGVPFSKTKSIFNTLNMSYTTDNLTVTSVTGLAHYKYNSFFDYGFSSLITAPVALGEKFTQFSQELRLVSDFDGPLNLTLGGYFEDSSRTDPAWDLLVLPGLPPVPDTRTGSVMGFASRSKTEGKALSAFGQLRWALTDTLEAAGGVRYTRERKKFNLASTFVNDANIANIAVFNVLNEGSAINGRFQDSNWSPELTLSWKPQPDTLVYAAYKTGYKSGGFSAPTLPQNTQNGVNLAFGPERSKGFEVGAKAMLLDRRIRVEATAYNYLYNGLQVSNFDQANLSYFIQNAASARIKGVELATEFRVIPQLTLNLSTSYNLAKYKKFPAASCYIGQTGTPAGSPYVAGTCQLNASGAQTFQDLSGEPLSRAPKWTVQGGFNFDTPINDMFNLGINADATYQSRYHTAETHNPVAIQDGFALLNAGIRLYQPDQGLEFSLIGRNLTNKYYYTISVERFGALAANELETTTNRGREFRVQASYRF